MIKYILNTVIIFLVSACTRTSEPQQLQSSVSLEKNVGQMDARVAYLARGSQHRVYVLKSGDMVFHVHKQSGDSVAVKLAWYNSNVQPTVECLNSSEQVSHYYAGTQQYEAVPHCLKTRHHALYPAVNLEVYPAGRGLEHDLMVAPNADPKQIKFGFDGHEKLEILDNGNLLLTMDADAGVTLQFAKPVVYQGTKSNLINASYALKDGVVSYNIGAYDTNHELVIDPLTVVYSSYLGGTAGDVIFDNEVDASGNHYVTGYTRSTDFPNVMGKINGSAAINAFVTKIDSAGTKNVWTSYFGGTGSNLASALKLDKQGNIYAAGYTSASDFPKVVNQYAGSIDAFWAQLGADGTLTKSRYFGGSAFDRATQIAFASDGGVVLYGTTSSIDIASAGGIQKTYGGGASDAFIARYNPAGDTVTAFTYLGGTGTELANGGLEVDGAGNVYVGGNMQTSFSWGPGVGYFPTSTHTPFFSCNPTLVNAFVVRMSPDLSGITYGGCYEISNTRDNYTSIALDKVSENCQAEPCLVVNVVSNQGYFNLGKLSPKANKLEGQVFYGTAGTLSAAGNNIAVDSQGNIWLSGGVGGSNGSIPGKDSQSLPGRPGTTMSGFVAKFGSKLIKSDGNIDLIDASYLGGKTPGTATDRVTSIALDQSDNLYVVGQAGTTDFPQVPARDSKTKLGHANGKDGFIMKISAAE